MPAQRDRRVLRVVVIGAEADVIPQHPALAPLESQRTHRTKSIGTPASAILPLLRLKRARERKIPGIGWARRIIGDLPLPDTCADDLDVGGTGARVRSGYLPCTRR